MNLSPRVSKKLTARTRQRRWRSQTLQLQRNKQISFCPLGNQSGVMDDTDPGAIVTDNQGHDLSYRTFINGILSGNILIDTSKVATDTVDYVATDTWGNTATSTRTIIIDANPNVATTSPSNAGVIATSTPTAQ